LSFLKNKSDKETDERNKELTLWDLVMKKGRSSKTHKNKQEKTCEQDLCLYDATKDIGLFSSVMPQACSKTFETHPFETLQDLFGSFVFILKSVKLLTAYFGLGPSDQTLTQNDYNETTKSIGTSKKKESQGSRLRCFFLNS
jgi:hypothetical protein